MRTAISAACIALACLSAGVSGWFLRKAGERPQVAYVRIIDLATPPPGYKLDVSYCDFRDGKLGAYDPEHPCTVALKPSSAR